jgi:hypothetical protein
MPEDQNTIGDLWTNHSSRILMELGWNTVGTLNMDLPGLDGKEKGVDALFFYEDPSTRVVEGVLVESKSYSHSSFDTEKIPKWINIIKQKLDNLRNSGEVYSQFPRLEKVNLRNAFLMIQIRDISDNLKYQSQLLESYKKVDVRERGKSNQTNIFIFENERTRRIFSVINSLKFENLDYKFYYPSFNGTRNISSNILNIQGLLSNFIITRKITDGKAEDDFCIYFFGKPKYVDFANLYDGLLKMQIIHAEGVLKICYFFDDDEFHKIKEDIKSLFFTNGEFKFTLQKLTEINSAPHWLES